MTLAALIIANENDDGADAPKLFGMALVEYQSRLARQAGATHLVIVATQISGALVEAVDMLKRSGPNVAIVRTAGEAANSIHPEEDVLLIAAGAVPDLGLLSDMAGEPGSSIAVEPLVQGDRLRDLIDAETMWAGIAKTTGSLVRETAGLLGDWALAPTLLRLAVQRGATRKTFGENSAHYVRFVVSDQDARAVEATAIARVGATMPGLSARWEQPLGSWLGQAFARFQVNSSIAVLVPSLLFLAALVCAGTGYLALAIVTYLVARVLNRAAQAWATAAQETGSVFMWLERGSSLIGAALIAAVGLVHSIWPDLTALVLAAWILWTLWLRGAQKAGYGPDEASALLVMLLGLVTGFLLASMGLVLAYCLFAQWQAKTAVLRE